MKLQRNKTRNSQIEQLVRLALKEDVGRRDITTRLLIRPTSQLTAMIQAEKEGVLCGVQVAQRVFKLMDSRIRFSARMRDGETLAKGQVIAELKGPGRGILSAERTALNFLSRLSGVATLTHQYVQAIQGTSAKIFDTRKTTPGWRYLEKYAVKIGGGVNHRMGLWDALLVKENHLRAISAKEPGKLNRLRVIRKITGHLKKRVSSKLILEIEVEDLEEFQEALEARPRIILLDNMGLDDIRKAVRLMKDTKGGKRRILLEVSGGVTLDRVRGLAEAGVDRISVGALTHSAPALDISLEVNSDGV